MYFKTTHNNGSVKEIHKTKTNR